MTLKIRGMPEKISPLHAFEEKTGATFGRWFNVLLPLYFSGTKSELHAARTDAAWFDLAFRSIVEVVGADARAFLQRITTNDIAALMPGASLLTAFLTAQAKVLGVADVLCIDDANFSLEVQYDQLEKLIALMKKFIITDDVRIHDHDATYTLVHIEGPAAEKAIKKLGASFSGRRWPRKFGSATGYTLITESTQADKLFEALTKAHIKPAGMNALNVLRLESGVPWYGLEMDENYLLPETGLRQAISFTKGCYPGQEIIARLESRGNIKKKLTVFEIDAPANLPPESPIHQNDAAVGKVMTSAFDPDRRRVVAMGYVSTESLGRSEPFEIGGRDATLKS